MDSLDQLIFFDIINNDRISVTYISKPICLSRLCRTAQVAGIQAAVPLCRSVSSVYVTPPHPDQQASGSTFFSCSEGAEGQQQRQSEASQIRGPELALRPSARTQKHTRALLTNAVMWVSPRSRPGETQSTPGEAVAKVQVQRRGKFGVSRSVSHILPSGSETQNQEQKENNSKNSSSISLPCAQHLTYARCGGRYFRWVL